MSYLADILKLLITLFKVKPPKPGPDVTPISTIRPPPKK